MISSDLAAGKTSSEIERLIEQRIRGGEYPPGAQLPTVRDLARSSGVNKNTVVRAYQALERKGYLELIRGRGAFVSERRRGELVALPWDGVDTLISAARQIGVGPERLLDALRRRVDRAYRPEVQRAAFIECNHQDIETLSGELGAAIGRSFEGVLLGDVAARADELIEQFDLVVTTFYHLGEVNTLLGARGEESLIGVHAAPSHDTLLKIARLHVPVIGLVCDLPNTVENLSYIIKTYQPAATILTMLIGDERLPGMLAKADAIVVTRSCFDRLMGMQPPVPVIPVSFTIEQQSIDFVRSRVLG
ncbi:MAG TPA: GntR family transcriptional regulator [Roseiflexaceae bacterium]|nr:GntR family transcriptional regulator [Roseiflexaceae bacterium]